MPARRERSAKQLFKARRPSTISNVQEQSSTTSIMAQEIRQCCVTGHIHQGTARGTVTQVAGLNTYISAPPNGSKDKTILFITDIFGYEFPVLLPFFNSIDLRMLGSLPMSMPLRASTSIFPTCSTVEFLADNSRLTMLGDAVPSHVLSQILPTKQQEAAKTAAEKSSDEAAGGAELGAWLGRQREEVVYPLMTNFLEHIRTDSSHKKVGAVGFCWGGRYAVLFTREGVSPFVDAAVAMHPSFLKIPEEIENVTKPVLIQVGDADAIMGAPDIQKTQEIFKGKSDCEIVVYPDQVHGFSVRGDLSVESDRKAKEKAAEKVGPRFKHC